MYLSIPFAIVVRRKEEKLLFHAGNVVTSTIVNRESNRHKEGDAPEWHNESRVEQIKQMLEGNEDSLLMETKGFFSDSSITPAFKEEWVEQCLSNKKNRYPDGRYFPTIFTTFDPAAGGVKSRSAVTSCVYTKDGTQVVCTCYFILF